MFIASPGYAFTKSFPYKLDISSSVYKDNEETRQFTE